MYERREGCDKRSERESCIIVNDMTITLKRFIRECLTLLSENIQIPDVVYHGSHKNFDSFDSGKSNYRGTIYFTTSEHFARAFASDDDDKPVGFIYHCRLSVNNPFDPTREDHRDALRPIMRDLIEQGFKDPLTGASFSIPKFPISPNGVEIPEPNLEDAVDWYLWRIKNGSWRILEGERVLNHIRENGFDALLTEERGAQNIAVFDPRKIQIIKKENLQLQERINRYDPDRHD